ncbi:homeobox transcription factor [Histoplasma capsulatum var. duboisii H88]|uniref:Homeobox transcription factor n=2 Tax=Ajellomyces capsulatus TaxID=5037 RepID=F0UAZ4_AJEC8|nr:homeobox transcription factor [Histoplasma capsulatum H143]EGC42957.1 homeobox transcription factor [Histoplasma capsulatum var. duboisii H88]QSS49145.1 homeobox transcription factor [Histoplasma capsulatum var. duboisii H88]
MSYLHHPFPFSGHHAIPVDQPFDYRVPIRQPPLSHPVDTYLLPNAPIDLAEYYHQAAALEDFEEYTENLSRPRLTKDQVDTLEAQFQAHPKPNSNVKRQLAAQTNLTLPRVANWFQNRRAKAKQQKRQEEFERMQASGNGEQWKNNDTKQKEAASKEQSERLESSATPTQQPDPSSSSLNPSEVEKEKQQQASNSISKPGLPEPPQKAMKATMPVSAQFSQPEEDNFPRHGPSDIKYHFPQSSLGNDDCGTFTSNLCGWNGIEDNHAIWSSSQDIEDHIVFPHLNKPHGNPLEICVSESQQFPCIQFNHEPGEWECHSMPHLMGKQRNSSQDLSEGFHPIPFHALQSPLYPDEHRRGSSSSEQSELADTLFHTEINGMIETSPQNTPHLNMAQLRHQVDPTTNWRYPEKEVDIAARRKRPRPAAIGTPAMSRSYGPSSVSPTTRIQGMGAGHVLRHAKSTQNLSPNRYPGIRKASVAQRSPLGITSFGEASRFNCANTADLMSTLPGLVTTSLAPPTPLTPEDLQTLLPPTPNDSQYCVSPTDDMGCARLFAMSQPVQVHIESPPTTPLHLGVQSHLQFQSMGVPMSTPSQHTPFQEYQLSIPTNPMSGGHWPDASSMSSPETSHLQQPTIHMPQPTHISPITYGESLDSGNPALVEDMMTGQRESPHCAVKNCNTPTASSPQGSSPGSRRVTEFLIQEFPEQQEAHRRAAEQLPPQKPMNYTFSNHTPNDF